MKKINILILSILACTMAHADGGAKKTKRTNQWYDAKNDVTWMRCSVGQRWDGRTCLSTAKKFKWHEAKKYAQTAKFAKHSDWRLPTVLELASLRRCSKGWQQSSGKTQMKEVSDGDKTVKIPRMCADYSRQPTLSRYSFPRTSKHWYWANSYTPDYAWVVDFRFGIVAYNFKTDKDYYLRLVRNGR